MNGFGPNTFGKIQDIFEPARCVQDPRGLLFDDPAGIRDLQDGKFVVIDIVMGAYEIHVNELEATDRLLARVPTAQIWLRRIGSRYAHHFGARPRSSGS